MAPFTFREGGGGSGDDEKPRKKSAKKKRGARKERRDSIKTRIVEGDFHLTFVTLTLKNGTTMRGRLRLVPHATIPGKYRDHVFLDDEQVDTASIIDIQ